MAPNFGVTLGQGQGDDGFVMRDAIAQVPEIIELQSDGVPLQLNGLENRPQVLPEVIRVAAEQRAPKSEVQLSDYLAVGAGFLIAGQLIACLANAVLLIAGGQDVHIVHPIHAINGRELDVGDIAKGDLEHM